VSKTSFKDKLAFVEIEISSTFGFPSQSRFDSRRSYQQFISASDLDIRDDVYDALIFRDSRFSELTDSEDNFEDNGELFFHPEESRAFAELPKVPTSLTSEEDGQKRLISGRFADTVTRVKESGSMEMLRHVLLSLNSQVHGQTNESWEKVAR
jgi:hypothetical protein